MDICLFICKNNSFCSFFLTKQAKCFYLYVIHFIISFKLGFLPYIRIPTR